MKYNYHEIFAEIDYFLSKHLDQRFTVSYPRLIRTVKWKSSESGDQNKDQNKSQQQGKWVIKIIITNLCAKKFAMVWNKWSSNLVWPM